MRRYISYVNAQGEAVGLSHIAVGYNGSEPVIACGAITSKMNWTKRVVARTQVCKNCLESTTQKGG